MPWTATVDRAESASLSKVGGPFCAFVVLAQKGRQLIARGANPRCICFPARQAPTGRQRPVAVAPSRGSV